MEMKHICQLANNGPVARKVALLAWNLWLSFRS